MNNRTVKELTKQHVESTAVGLSLYILQTFTEKTQIYSKYKRIYFPVHSIMHNKLFKSRKWKQIVTKYNCDSICLTGLDYHEVKESNVDLVTLKLF